MRGDFYFILLDRRDTWHGQGFVLRKELRDSVESVKQVDEWIAILRLKLTETAYMTLINVHAPTNDKSDEQKKFYESLSAVYKKYKRDALVYITGDFNARVGSRKRWETSIGSFPLRQKRNEGGQRLVDFCEMEGLFLCNTSFKHKSSCKATWTSVGKNDFYQIDYILCNHSLKGLLYNSKSCPATKFSSDHFLILAKLSVARFRGRGQEAKKKKEEPRRYQPLRRELLVESKKHRDDFRDQFEKDIAKISKNGTALDIWKQGILCMQEVAEKIVGRQERKAKGFRFYDEKLQQVSQRHCDLRMELINNTRTHMTEDQKKTLKNKINRVSHERDKRLRELENEKLDTLVAKVEQFHLGARAFEAVKELKNNTKKSGGVVVHDSEGNVICNKSQAASAISDHFEKLFTSPNVKPIPPFSGPPKPLTRPITPQEVLDVFKKLKNRKAVGPDNLPVEVLKATGLEGATVVAEVLNQSFYKHEPIGVGEGILAPLQKPGKVKGPLSNIRPIVLLTLLRKVLSLITLGRCRDKFEVFLSFSQAAFRMGRSTSDILWAHRWLIAKVIRYHKAFYILGLDMSRAFDTILRDKLLVILRDDVCLKDDELRMCQMLLADTTLSVRFENVLADPFTTTIGTPQGDGLSPVLFAIYLEKAMRDLRGQMPDRLLEDKDLPEEAIYADDVDFFSSSIERLDKIKELVPPTIGKYNLNANKDKWEQTYVTHSEEEDKWKGTKKLGSLLGDEEDINRRMALATVQFKSLEKLWIRSKCISLRSRMRAYNAFVMPVLLYNGGTWGVCKSVERKLESFHRTHLRRVMGIRWPYVISNKVLYDRWEAESIGFTLRRLRWNLFGYVLRLNVDTPAQIAMDNYCNSNNMQKLRGRTQTTLPVILFHEYHVYKKSLKSPKLTYVQKPKLRNIACDRKKWSSLSKAVCEINRDKK